MTEQARPKSPQAPYKPFVNRILFRSASPTTILWCAGGGLAIAGIEWPQNRAMVYSGLGTLFLAYILGKYTRMGREGPVTLKEEVAYGPDGKVERVR